MSHSNSPDSFLKRSLFRNNSCSIGKSYWGLISSSSSNVTVAECIFLNNKAKHTFGTGSSGIITVINCTGDVLTASSSNDGIVYTNEMKVCTFDLTLSLLSLGKCEAAPISVKLSLCRSNNNKKLVFEDLFSFNFSLECLIN
ncbi:hypothetical protein TVAGG3_0872580, partial [Trichomonas vaginalis G3]